MRVPLGVMEWVHSRLQQSATGVRHCVRYFTVCLCYIILPVQWYEPHDSLHQRIIWSWVVKYLAQRHTAGNSSEAGTLLPFVLTLVVACLPVLTLSYTGYVLNCIVETTRATNSISEKEELLWINSSKCATCCLERLIKVKREEWAERDISWVKAEMLMWQWSYRWRVGRLPGGLELDAIKKVNWKSLIFPVIFGVA